MRNKAQFLTSANGSRRPLTVMGDLSAMSPATAVQVLQAQVAGRSCLVVDSVQDGFRIQGVHTGEAFTVTGIEQVGEVPFAAPKPPVGMR